MLQNVFLVLLVLAWILVIMAAFCPLRGWLQRRSERNCEKKRPLTPVKD
jgi:hypothetical protein